MKIASVIVDVPAKQTDRTFDYLVPERLEDVIAPGVRVNVPFGPRQVQGFVTDIKTESDFDKLREISESLDLTPVLNPELLELGEWLTEHSLCYKISAFQAMLPAALKAKYEKKVVLTKGTTLGELDEAVQELFGGSDEADWGEAVSQNLVNKLKREAEAGLLDVVYKV